MEPLASVQHGEDNNVARAQLRIMRTASIKEISPLHVDTSMPHLDVVMDDSPDAVRKA